MAKSSYIHCRENLLLALKRFAAYYAVKQGGIRAYHALVKYWEIVTQKIPGVLLRLMGIVLEVQGGRYMVTLRKWVDTVLRKRNINRQPLPCSNSSGVIVGRLDFFTTPLNQENTGPFMHFFR